MRRYWFLAGLAVFLVAPAAAQAPLGPVPSAQALSTPATPMPNTNAPPTQASGLGAISIYTATSVNEFLTACRTDQSGCMNEIGNAYLKHLNGQDDVTICLNDVTYGKPVPSWLASHSETHTMTTESGIYLALQKLYPCNSR